MTSLHIIFLSGASGAGKTTLIKELEKRYSGPSKVAFLYFDSIGVPSEEEMIKAYGSGREWQKAMTFRWVETILKDYADYDVVLLEGQVGLNFILEAFEKYKINNYDIILIHAEAEERHRRLQLRNHPDLINEQMDNWANYLLKQAKSHNCQIIDTSKQSTEEALTFLEAFLVEK